MTNKNQKIIEPIDAPNTDPMDAADEFELQRMKLLNDLAVAHVIIPGTAFKPANRHSSSTDFFYLDQFNGFVSGFAQGSTTIVAPVPQMPATAQLYGFYPFMFSQDIQFDVSLYRVDYYRGTSTMLTKVRANSNNPGSIIPVWADLSGQVGTGLTSFHVQAQLTTSNQRIYGIRVYYRE